MVRTYRKCTNMYAIRHELPFASVDTNNPNVMYVYTHMYQHFPHDLLDGVQT